MSARARLLSILIVLALIAGLSGIAFLGGESAGEDTESLFSRRETINLWYTDEALSDYLNSVAVAYTDSQSQYRVEPTLIDDTDYIQTLYDASVEGEDYPDVFLASNDYLGRLWLTGLAAEVTDTGYFTDETYFCTAAQNAVTYQEKILGYPFSFEAAAFLYNEEYLQTMADTAGVSLSEAIPETMIDVITLANSYDAPENVSAVLKWDVSDIFYNYCFLGYYLSIGGETGDDSDTLKVYNQQLISCLQVYQQLNQFFSIDTSTDDYESVIASFAAGEIVFTLATTDAVETIAAYCAENGTELSYGVTAIPDLTGDLKSRTLSITNCMVINGYSDKQDAAGDFIRYVIFDNADTLYSQTGKMSALAGVTYDDEHLSGFYEAYVDSAPITKLRSASNFWMLLENTFAQVWDGEDPNEQLRLLCEQLLIQMTGSDTVSVTAIEDPEYVDIQSELEGGE